MNGELNINAEEKYLDECKRQHTIGANTIEKF